MISTAPRSSESASPFRIWTPPDERYLQSEQDSSDIGLLTLRQTFERFLLPGLMPTKHAQKPQSTIASYYNAIGHWERLMPSNPTLHEFDDDLMLVFQGRVDQAATTCNKWFRHIRAILNRMGPRVNHNPKLRHNVGYFSDVPYIEALEEEESDPIEMPESHIDALYQHAEVATWPPRRRTGCHPAIWWRCSLVYLINYAPRRDDWRWLSRSPFDFEKNEFNYRAKKTRKLHHLVFNEAWLSHLELLPSGTDLVFCPSKCNRQLYEQWHKIQKAAGVERKDNLPYGFHDLRQTAASRYHDHAPGTAEMLLGHAIPRNAQVTAKSYLGRNFLKPLWKAIQTIPQPASFMPVIQAYRARMGEAG